MLAKLTYRICSANISLSQSENIELPMATYRKITHPEEEFSFSGDFIQYFLKFMLTSALLFDIIIER
jgi:hypothetical protein